MTEHGEGAFARKSALPTYDILRELLARALRFVPPDDPLCGEIRITQHFATLRSRAWAILHNYWPWSPSCRASNGGAGCPAERLNGKRYADNWLENLLIAASLGGTKNYLPKKRNN